MTTLKFDIDIFTDNLFNLHLPFKIKTYCGSPKIIPLSFVLSLQIGFSLLLMTNHMIGIVNISLPLELKI